MPPSWIEDLAGADIATATATSYRNPSDRQEVTPTVLQEPTLTRVVARSLSAFERDVGKAKKNEKRDRQVALAIETVRALSAAVESRASCPQ